HPGDFDYITAGRDANQIRVSTKDGREMSAKDILLRNSDYPEYCSCHVRDPKVTLENGIWRMVLGARTLEDEGCVLIYEGNDPDEFRFIKKLSYPDFGYMWECPDMFELGGNTYLSVSPQGLSHEEFRFQNVYSSGYFKVTGDELSDFEEFDYGFDFYAPQTFETTDGRRILIGWMGMASESGYTNPTVDFGRQHCLTLPRELTVSPDGSILQNPIREIYSLRISPSELRSEKRTYKLPFDIVVNEVKPDPECVLEIGKAKITWHSEGFIELSFADEKAAGGRTVRKVKTDNLSDIRIVADRSSLEVFLNSGRYVMSTRFYPEDEMVSVSVSGFRAQLFELEIKNTLVAIGEALIDFIPDRKGCDFGDVSAFSPAPGGAPANVTAAFSKLGGNSRMVTQLGKDPFGDMIIRTLEDSGVDTSAVSRTDKANTALAFVSLSRNGNRTFSFYRNPSADMLLSPEQIIPDMFDDCSFLHFCSVSLGDFPMKEAHRTAISMARRNGAVISFDPNLRFMLWNDRDELKKAVLEFMPEADILKISDEELEFITGEKEFDKALPGLLTGNVKLVIYTCGADGAYAANREGIAYAPGHEVITADTTGAGDCFIGAFLRCLELNGIKKDDLDKITSGMLKAYLGFANACSAVSVTRKGAIPSYPTLEEVLRGGLLT
ncbi:MAG: GH32 C-terminal domain-containing protein, partial [Clostridiales bacterium]|nr:GH32 C-terminal domain-containing protein [Clostridiales bacterium]